MAGRTNTRFLGLFASIALAAAVLAGCTSPLIKTPLADGLEGNLDVRTVQVAKTPGINSVQIVPMLQSALEEEMGEKASQGKPAEMHVVITEYRGPDNQLGGVMGSRLMGGKFYMRGRIKIVDPSSEAVLAEYDAIGRHDRAAGTVDFSHTPFERLIEDFTYWVVDPIT